MKALLIALWLALSSLIAFALMYFDKRAAERRRWRIPEATLLLWAFLGGGIGAKLGQKRFRHKTRKEPFRTVLNLALVANAGLFGMLLWPGTRQQALDVLVSLTR